MSNHNSFSLSFLFLNCTFIVFACSPASVESGEDPWGGMEQILEILETPQFPDRDYLVTYYGAIGDGQTDARPAIMEAIQDANKDGGGRVVLPEGTWYSEGPVHLKSNVNLHVSEGAVLRFSEDARHYLPQVLTRWEGTEAFNFSPLIYAYQATNVALTGKGTIDGNSEHGFGTWRDNQGDAQNRLREMGAAGVPVHERVFGMDDYLRPSMIQFFGCNRILVEDVTVNDSPMWVIHIIYGEHVTVRGVTVESYRLNNDGVSIDSSVMVLIKNNSFHTGDDSIVIKAGRDQDAWRVGRPSENIVVRNNYMEGHNALAVGSEMSGGVRNIYMENNRLGEVLSAIYFKSNLDRGGSIENLRVRNIEVEQANTLLRFRTDYHGYRGEHHPPLYRDFLIEDVTALKVQRAIQATGVEDSPILDVHVRNMTVEEAEVDIDTAYVRNFVLENVSVNGRILE